MRTRLMSTFFLVLVLLNGAMGSVLAAVLCPHTSGVLSCCSVGQSSQHDHMSGMEMPDGMPMDGMEHGTATPSPDTVSETEREAVSAGNGLVPCSHCITHSRAVSTPLFLREADHRNDQVAVAAPISAVQFLAPSITFFHLVSARPHAPPGSQTRRHILLNVFRI
jgi:hypothetical protein